MSDRAILFCIRLQTSILKYPVYPKSLHSANLEFSYADKRLWLTSLFRKVLYSDIIIRKNIHNERGMSLLIRKLATA